MINKLQNNTKIKVISLMSSIVLWMYVMAVVDPHETKLYEDVRVIITNMDELAEQDLEIYPEIDETTDIYLKGKRSDLQKVDKDDITIKGEINNPGIGKKELIMEAKVSKSGVLTEFKNSNVKIIELEKKVTEMRSIDVETIGNEGSIDEKTLSQDSVKITGPTSLVQQVQKVVSSIDTSNYTTDFKSEVKLKPVDKDGNIVEGITLDTQTISVTISLLKEKEVPIKIKLKETDNNEEVNLSDYETSDKYVTIKGSKELVDSIEAIETKPIDTTTFKEAESKKIQLDIPEGISANKEYITVKNINEKKAIKEEINYSQTDIEIRNNTQNIDVSSILIPEEIKVSVEYDEDEISGEIDKSKIKLYVDLTNFNPENKEYTIEYETEYKLTSITITPNSITIE